jgi:hypothetical protein
MLARALSKFTSWALSKNPPGFYREGDPSWAHVLGRQGDPYMTRVRSPWIWVPFVGKVQVRLHRFHRGDLERALHNHPFRWALSIILSGSYDEERLAPDADDLARLYECATGAKAPKSLFTTTRHVRWFNFLTDSDYHAVRDLHGDVWTLFIVGPRTQEWGFLVDDVHVPSYEYQR